VNSIEAFFWGCAGSAAIEVVLFCNAVRRSKTCRLSAPYRRPAFVVGRLLLIPVAGLLTAAWGISHPLQGVALGAATPRLMEELERLGVHIT
jgi:hypothetical protein